MTNELMLVAIILVGFVFYVAAKVIAAMRKSARQWQQVDKSKLKTWDDDED